MLELYKIFIYGIFIVFAVWLYLFVFRPNFQRSGGNLKMKVRSLQIKQIKHNIKEMNIKKKELFDE